MATKKTMAIGTSAAAVALLAGLGLAGVASAADSSTTSPDSSTSAETGTGTAQSSASEGQGKGGHRGAHRGGERGGLVAAGLAEKLGVEESKLSEALQSFKKANKAAERPVDGVTPDRSEQDAALAKSLAGSLGLDEAKVTAALSELRAEKQSARAAALTSKLEAAVSDGTLTQADADAVTKAIERGVIGGR